jgi:signal transduction histidine kinase
VERILIGREIKFRLLWFVVLRYVATVALALLPLANLVLPDPGLDVAFVAPLVGALLVYNTAVLLVINGVRFRRWRRWGLALAHAQILIDFALLSVIAHFTGGGASPVLFFFVFHAIIAAILLLPFEAYVHVALGVTMVLSAVLLEYAGVLDHHGLAFVTSRPCLDSWYVAPKLSFFAVTMFLSVYMTSSIAREIGARERLVSETVARLQQANEALRQQEKTRSQFVRTVAHDLKEPLASVQSMLKVVLDGYTGEVNPKAHDMIARAERSTTKLIGMIRDMLDLGRMRVGWLGNRSNWAAETLVKAVDDKLRPLAEEHGQALTHEIVPPTLTLSASFDAFEQVLLNLVSNALKYSPDGKPVHVRVERQGAMLRLVVEDQGIGIPPNARVQLFSEFFRADNARRLTRDGTGLGLSIVRSIVQQYNGTIEAESPYDDRTDGSRFVVRIPWKEVAA